MADEDRLILETAFDLTGATASLKKLHTQATAAGGKIGDALGTATTKGAAQAVQATRQLEQAKLRAALAEQTLAQRVKTLSDRYSEIQRTMRGATAGTTAHIKLQTQAVRAQEQLTKATQAYSRAQDQAFAKQQRQQKGVAGPGGSPVLPRSFAGFTGGGLAQAAGALGVVTTVAEFVGTAKQYADAGREINASIDGNRVALGSLLQNVDRGNAIFTEGAVFARKYGFTQAEVAESMRASSAVFRESAASTEKILEVQARLAAFSPEQGLAGASYAIRELAGGDTQSLVERFEISRQTVNAWKAEVQSGADVVDVLDRGLSELGITNDVLKGRTEGLAGAQRLQNQSLEDLQRRLGELVQSSGWVQFTTRLTTATTKLLGGDTKAETDALLEQAETYQQFIDLRRQAVQEGMASFDAGANVKALYLIGDYLTEAEFNTRKLMTAQEDLAATTGETATVFSAAGYAAQANANAQSLVGSNVRALEQDSKVLNEEIERTERAMRQAEAAAKPYKDALDDAQSAVTGLEGQLADAQAEFDRFANAQTEQEAEFVKRRRALAIESAQAALDLLNFEAPGGGLDQALGPIQQEIDAATGELGGFEAAVDSATAAVAEAERAVARAEDGLRPYKDAIKDAERAIKPYEEAVKAAQRGLEPYEEAVRAAEDAVKSSEDAYDDLADGMAGYDQAVESAQRSLDAQNDALKTSEQYLDDQNQILRETEDRYKAVEDAIDAQYGALQDWQNKDLIGTDRYRQATQAIDDRILAARQNINALERSGADDDAINRAREALDKLRLEKEAIELAAEADIGRAQRELEDRARTTEEVSVGDAQTGIDSAIAEIERLDEMLPEHQAAIDAQIEAVAGAESAVAAQAEAVAEAQRVLDANTEAQRLYQVQLDNAKLAIDAQREAVDLANESLAAQKEKVDLANEALATQKGRVDAAREAYDLQKESVDRANESLDAQKEKLDVANTALDTQRTRVEDLGKQLDTTREQALKPFQDKIDELGRQAETLDLREKLELVPLRDEINDLKQPIETLPFDVIITGMNKSGVEVAYLSDQLLIANEKLAEAKLAYEEAQKPIDTYRDTVADLKLKSDELKTATDLANTAITDSIKPTEDATKATSELADQKERLNRANTTGSTQQPFIGPLQPGTGSGYDAKAIDGILAGTGLAGQGGNIAKFAQQYNVPAELALAMFRKEASFLTAGSSVANNNPGNIVYTGGAYGEAGRGADGRFGKYATVEDGVEAYFKLLDKEYRSFIDSGDTAGLINKYAPPFENNTTQYVDQVQQWLQEYLAKIAAAPTPEQTGPRLNQEDLLGSLIDAINGGELTQGYHTGPGWGGIDIGAPMGADIRSVQAGKVVQSGYGDVSGNFVVIEDLITGLKTYYGHMKELGAAVGTMVEAGDIIGKVGSTGQSSGPHTHFQAWVDNVLQNPLKLLELLVSEAYGGTGAGVDMPWDNVGANNVAPPERWSTGEDAKKVTQTLAELLEIAGYIPAGSKQKQAEDDSFGGTKGRKRYNQWVESLDLLEAGAKNAAKTLAEMPIVVRSTTDEMAGYVEDFRLNGNPFAGQKLGIGDYASVGDVTAGRLGGAEYAMPSPVGTPIFEAPAIGEELEYGIAEPVGESLIAVTETTTAIKDLMSYGSWQQTIDDQALAWNTIRDNQIQTMRETLDYFRSGDSLARGLAKSIQQAADDAKAAAASIPGSVPTGGGGGGSGDGTPPATTNNTLNIFTNNRNSMVDQGRRMGFDV